jgi:hypothetical protein
MIDLASLGAELREAVRDDASSLVELEAGVRRRRRRRRGSRIAALVAIVAVVGGLAVFARNGSSQHVAATGPTTVTTPAITTPPPGQRFVDYGELRIAVPQSWEVVARGSVTTPCSDHGFVALGDSTVEPSGCNASDLPVIHVEESPSASPSTASVEPREFNGVPVVLAADSVVFIRYEVPTLHAALTFTGGADPEAVLPTVTRSARYFALNEAVAATKDWQTVAYSGVSFRVPAAWSVMDLESGYNSEHRIPIFLCGQPQTPEVDLGRGITPSCPYVPPGPPADGVWAFPDVYGGPGQQPGWTPLRIGEVDTLVGPESGEGTLDVAIIDSGKTPLIIRIGLGPDGHLASAILHSITRS